MRIILLLLSSAYVVFTTDDDLTNIIQETLRHMLDFSDVPNENIVPPFHVSHRNTATMQAIYDTFVEDDGSDDGNIVRGIDPAIGKLDGQEVLIFDISGFEKEQIMRGELHFYLRRRDASKSGRARQLRAKSLCLNDYCNENQELEMIVITPEKVVWDVTKPLAEANALTSSQIVIRISRRDVRMRRYVDIVKKCTPFLLVYSRAENTVDAEMVRKRVENTRSKRNELENNSHKSAIEPTSQSTRSTTEVLLAKKTPFRPLFKEKTPLPKRTKIRRSRNKSSKEDIWQGFGEMEEVEKVEKRIAKSNDIRVVLKEVEEKETRCQKRGSLVDMKNLGWEKWIIAPPMFEAGFCSGKCPNPLPKEMHPSNHALLQSLLHSSTVPSVCCSPEHMHSFTIFYRDEIGRLTIKNFDNMIVESCTCE